MLDSTISTIDDLLKLARSHWSGHFVYRGEDATSYTLRPKFGRVVAKTGWTKPEHEIPMLRQFEREAITHLRSRPADDWEWLTIAQHHGLATRLLDWTTNPLVAAFFACEHSRGDGVLYAFDSDKLTDNPNRASPFSMKHDALFRPRHATNRITAQAGLFTVHASPTDPFAPPSLERHVIEEAAMVELEATLRYFDVHRAKLFPGLDSLAKHVNSSFGAP